MTPVRWSFPDELDRHEASFDEDDPWGADALAVEATEYVTAEARVEPFWLALMIMAAVPFVAVGIVLLVSLL